MPPPTTMLYPWTSPASFVMTTMPTSLVKMSTMLSPGTVMATLNLRGRNTLPYSGSGEPSKLVPKPLKALSAVTLGLCRDKTAGSPPFEGRTVV